MIDDSKRLSSDVETPSNGQVDSLPPSKLGTHEHWDQTYHRELESFQDIGDEGEVWFGEDSSDEILVWIAEHLPLPLTARASVSEAESAQSDPQPGCSPHILDGTFLISL